jgi:hypothetical protein
VARSARLPVSVSTRYRSKVNPRYESVAIGMNPGLNERQVFGLPRATQGCVRHETEGERRESEIRGDLLPSVVTPTLSPALTQSLTDDGRPL